MNQEKPIKLTFSLKKAAAWSGGDRYTCKEIKGFDIYFPQMISRPLKDEPVDTLYTTVSYV